jgi:hypothetical protein
VNGLIYSGGARVDVSPNVSFSQCIFSSLTSGARNGGVMYIYPTPPESVVAITDCVFENQQNKNATIYGGYIAIAYKPSILKV